MKKLIAAALVSLLALVAGRPALGVGLSYPTAGSLISENFDGLPTDMPSNANIQTGGTAYVNGWTDDTPTVAGTNVGITGWYLFHPIDPAMDEDGANHHQRLRVGPGANTGSFWLFGASADNAEKALGDVGSTTVAANGANMYTGLQLINNTGQTLTTFTLTYDGEQWRDGQSTTGETLVFDFSTSATAASWSNPATPFSVVPGNALDFTAPVVGGTSSGGTAVDGNGAGLVSNITATISNITWSPGGELWLRWADPQLASNADDGLAIDNVRFTAAIGGGNPTDITSVTSGLASAASTWSNNQPPSVVNTYRVLNTHTVTVNAPFVGSELRANTGGTVNFSANAVDVPLLVIDPNGHLTETVAGDFTLGDVSATGSKLQLNGTADFAIAASGNLNVDVKLLGSGDMNVNGAAGSSLNLRDTTGHLGTIHFDGSGSQVVLNNANGGVGTLAMNSSGANKLVIGATADTATGNWVFSKAGIVDHAAEGTARLQGALLLQADAAVSVDLTKPQPDGNQERRLLFGTNAANSGLKGSGSITVTGTPNADHVGGTITLNEFEVGSTGEPATLPVDAYAGTFTANDFVNVELRHSEAGAKFVVNNHARLEMGHQVTVAPAVADTVALGEVVVNSGGVVEVGFEQNISGDDFPEGHALYNLNLSNASGRSGGMTINAGGTLRMQVNGTTAGLFDTVTATGPVQLGGTLNVLINPEASTGTATAFADLADYSPAINDVITIITTVGTPLASDFNNSGSVDNTDFTTWTGGFGQATGQAKANGDSDADGDVDGVDFLTWQRQRGLTTAGITGTFANVDITDPTGAMAGKTFQVIVTSTAVQLKVIAAATSAVPEPATVAMLALVALVPALARKRRQR